MGSILDDVLRQVAKMKTTPAKVEYETIKRDGHTYKRVKGTRDRWIDESGNEIDYSGNKPVVISKKEERIGSGDSVSNPDVWIKDGKAYRTNIPGGRKTTYLTAVYELGKYLGWDANVGEKSKKAIAKQEEVFNKAKYKNEAGDTYNKSNNGILLISKPVKATPVKQPTAESTLKAVWDGTKAVVKGGWDRMVETYNSGNNKVNQGFSQFFYGKGNSNIIQDMTDRIAGLSKVVLGFGEGTVGALFNGLADKDTRDFVGKYGQALDVGQDANTIAELFQGNWMAPWDENNTGLLSNNFTWIGTQDQRQDFSDFLNASVMLAGSKGVKPSVKGVKNAGRKLLPKKRGVVTEGALAVEGVAPQTGIVSQTANAAVKGVNAFKHQRSNLPKGTKASVVRNLLRKDGAENVVPRNAGNGTMIYRVTYADGTVKDFYYKGKRHVSTSEVSTPRPAETSVGYEPVGEPIKPLQEEQPVVASEPILQVDESVPTPTESTPVAYMPDEPVPTPIEPFVAGVETPKPIAVGTPSAPSVVESPVGIAAVERAPEPVPVGVVEPVVERVPEPSVPSTNGTSVGIAEAATGEAPKPAIAVVVEQPQPGRPLTSYGESFIYDQPFDKNTIQIGDKVQLHDGSLLTITGRKGDKFSVSNDLNPGLTATYSADDLSRSYMQSSQPFTGNYSVVRNKPLSIGDDVQLQGSTGYDYGTIVAKVDDDAFLVKLSDGTYQKVDDSAILGLDYSRSPEGRFRHYYRQVRNPDLMLGTSFKNFDALAYPERFATNPAGAQEALRFQLQHLGIPIENDANFSRFVTDFADQKIDPIFTFRQLYRTKHKYGFKDGGKIRYFR